MPTDRQMEANQVNAHRSSGPKTAAGKARSKLNALRHGLTASSILIPGEDAAEFGRLLDRLTGGREPTSALEGELLRAATAAVWRLRRGARFEAAIFAARAAEFASPTNGGNAPTLTEIGDLLIRDATDGDALGKVGRHEATLMRNLERSLKMLSELREAPPMQ